MSISSPNATSCQMPSTHSCDSPTDCKMFSVCGCNAFHLCYPTCTVPDHHLQQTASDNQSPRLLWAQLWPSSARLPLWWCRLATGAHVQHRTQTCTGPVDRKGKRIPQGQYKSCVQVSSPIAQHNNHFRSILVNMILILVQFAVHIPLSESCTFSSLSSSALFLWRPLSSQQPSGPEWRPEQWRSLIVPHQRCMMRWGRT